MAFKQLLLILFMVCILFSSGFSLADNMNEELSTMRLKLINVGDPVLRNKARALTKEQILSPSIQQLIALMKTTMRDAPGVGLAAPQVGISLQLAVIEDRKEYLKGLTIEEIRQRDRHPVPFHVIINPKMTILETENHVDFFEGCLSLNGFLGKVPRAIAVKVAFLDEKGQPVTIQAKGWYARILQHEIDHLHGKLYIDRMIPTTFTTTENYKKFHATS